MFANIVSEGRFLELCRAGEWEARAGTERPVTLALCRKFGWVVSVGDRDSVEDSFGRGMLAGEGGEIYGLWGHFPARAGWEVL